jgi:hypothetical protein
MIAFRGTTGARGRSAIALAAEIIWRKTCNRPDRKLGYEVMKSGPA